MHINSIFKTIKTTDFELINLLKYLQLLTDLINLSLNNSMSQYGKKNDLIFYTYYVNLKESHCGFKMLELQIGIRNYVLLIFRVVC